MRIGWQDNDRGISVYQSRGYGVATSVTAGAQWGVIGDEEGRWRVPLCISKVGDSGLHDAASPYGYSGIGSAPGMASDEIARAWDSTLEALSARDIVSVFFRFAPYRNDLDRYRGLRELELVELSDTVIVELGDETLMWDAMHGRSRTAIRKAEREGLQARVVEQQPLSLPSDRGFRRVYEVAMDRVGASEAHRHQDGYYDTLIHATDVDMRLVEVFNRDDEVVAASLLLIDEEAVHYHLSGSVVDAAKNGANNLLIWTAMKWAAERKYTRFHLGGGTSRDDGLFRFKASFGGKPLPFFVGRLIVDPHRYDQLVLRRAASLGVASQVLRDGTFFPAYRAVAP